VFGCKGLSSSDTNFLTPIFGNMFNGQAVEQMLDYRADNNTHKLK